jgi:hypothetical protein
VTAIVPSACRWCDVPEQEHLQRWSAEYRAVHGTTGWHVYEQPTEEQRRQRMLARRASVDTKES